MNRKQRRAQAKLDRKNKPNVIWGKSYKIPTYGPFVKFDLVTELNKMHQTVTNDPMPYTTRSTKVDFDSVDWGNDGGFVIAVLPFDPQTSSIGFYTPAASSRGILGNFKQTRIAENLVMLSCYCSPDRAWTHYNEIADNLEYAYIGYSTPRNIHVLSEQRHVCAALKGQSLSPEFDAQPA